MNTVAIWIMVSISAGGYNHGTMTVIEKFATRQDCIDTYKQMPTGSFGVFCVPAKVVKP